MEELERAVACYEGRWGELGCQRTRGGVLHAVEDNQGEFDMV